MRTRIQNALQAMYVKIREEIETLNQQVEEQAGHRCGARLLLTHPGVGPVTALATDVWLEIRGGLRTARRWPAR
jgi:transposase